jgi:hypothetical protein
MDKQKARRRLLKSLAAGSGAIVAGKSLPENWGRPVVDSVMLPAHAQTSLLNSSGPGSLVNQNVFQGPREQESLLAYVADALLPQARGQGLVEDALFILLQQSTSQVCVEHVREGGEAPDVANFSAMVTFGQPGCESSLLLTAKNVPANPGVNTPAIVTPQCSIADGIVSIGESLGLIPPAYAGQDGMVGPWVNLHTLNGPSGGSFGYFSVGPFQFKFDLPRGDCPGLVPVCGENCILDGQDGDI